MARLPLDKKMKTSDGEEVDRNDSRYHLLTKNPTDGPIHPNFVCPLSIGEISKVMHMQGL